MATTPTCKCGAPADVITTGGEHRCSTHQPLGAPGAPAATPLYEVRNDFPEVADYLTESAA